MPQFLAHPTPRALWNDGTYLIQFQNRSTNLAIKRFTKFATWTFVEVKHCDVIQLNLLKHFENSVKMWYKWNSLLTVMNRESEKIYPALENKDQNSKTGLSGSPQKWNHSRKKHCLSKIMIQFNFSNEKLERLDGPLVGEIMNVSVHKFSHKVISFESLEPVTFSSFYFQFY